MSAQEEKYQSQPEKTSGKAERAQLDHVLLDVDFLHKPTVKEFRLQFGWTAIGWLIEMYCLMSRATDGQISKTLAIGTAEDMRLDNGAALVDYCLKHGLLELEDDSLVNSRVIKDQESCARNRARWRRAKANEETTEDSARNDTRNEASRPRESVNIYEHNEDHDLKKNSQPLPPDLEWTNEYLEPVESEIVQRSNLFINSGKRPMRKYPLIWLTPLELSETVDRYVDAGIPKQKLKLGFQNVSAWIRKKLSSGSRIESLDAFSALIGFGLTNALQQHNESLKVQRNTKLNGAEPEKPPPKTEHHQAKSVLENLGKQTGINLLGGK